MKTSSQHPRPARVMRPWLRMSLSALIVLHLTAIFFAPMSQPPPASLLSQRVADFFSPYLNATHQFHGYRFFAPNPGPSHLVRYVLKMPGGEEIAGQFPDAKVHFPRLLYHRHFMLSEFLNSQYPPPLVDLTTGAEQEAPSEAFAVFRSYAGSYAQHLLARHDAERVTMELVRHNIALPRDVLEGQQLSNETLYEKMPLGIFERGSQ